MPAIFTKICKGLIKKQGIFTLAIIQSFSGSAWADNELFELSLHSLLDLEVSSPSKFNESIYEAPGVVSVLSREEIHRYGGTSLRDVMGRLPGVVLLSDGDIQNDNLGIRGDSLNRNNHVLFLIDGQPFRSIPGSSDANRRLINSFPLDMVESIEFIRGPGSVLYGASAFTAVINIVTRRALQDELSITLGAGSHGTRLASMTGSTRSFEDDYGLIMNVQGWHDEGWTASLTDVYGQATDVPIGEDSRTITASGYYEDLDFTLFAGNRDSDLFGQRVGFAPGELEDEHTYAALDYEYEINDRTQLISSASWLHLNINDGQFKDDEYVLGLDLKHALSDSLDALIGVNSMKTNFRSKLPILDNFKTEIHMLYGQVSYQLAENTELVLGTQLNHAKGRNEKLVPRFALSHQFSRNWGSKLQYSEAYRSPNAIETSTFVPTVITGNENLKPETVETSELEIFFHDQHSFASLSVFSSKQRDLVAPKFNPDELIVEYQNVNTRHFYGAELSAKYTWEAGYQIDGSISHQRNKQKGEQDEADEHDISTLPRTLAKLGVSYHEPLWDAGLWNSFVDEYRNTSRYEASKLPYNADAGSYHYMTAKAAWRPELLPNTTKEIEFSFYIQNLLNEDIRQHSLTTATPLNSFPSETDRAYFVSAQLWF